MLSSFNEVSLSILVIRNPKVRGLKQDDTDGAGIALIFLEGPGALQLLVMEDVLPGRYLPDIADTVDVLGLEFPVGDLEGLEEGKSGDEIVSKLPELFLGVEVLCGPSNIALGGEILIEGLEDHDALGALTVLNLVHAVGLGFGGVGEFQKVEGMEQVWVMEVVVLDQGRNVQCMVVHDAVNLLEIYGVLSHSIAEEPESSEDRVLNSFLVVVGGEEPVFGEGWM